jgi:hypothetical protein
MQMLKCGHIYTSENKSPISKTINIYTLQKSLLAQRLSGNRRVEALLRLVLLERLHGEGSASLGASRLLDTSEPDHPASAKGTGAGLEANIWASTTRTKDKVTVVVDLEGAALLVRANGLDTGGVADDALAHAAAVDVQLERGVEGVDVDTAGLLVEREGGVVDAAGGVVAVAVDDAGLVVLVGRVDEEAALAGLDGAVLDGGAAAQRHQTEDIAGLGAREGRRGLGKGGGDGGHGGSGGGGGEFHVDGLEAVLSKCGNGSCSD